MFWGLILKANKKYTQTLEKPFHLSQAALDYSSSDDQPIQVMYSHEDSSYLLCTLQKGKVLQCALDLNFAEGDKLCFLSKGNGIVHLTGFLVPDDDLGYGAFDSEEEEEVSETETPDLREKLNKKKGGKKELVEAEAQSDESGSDEEVEGQSDESGSDEDDSDLDMSALNNDDDDDDEDEDEDESEEEEEVAPPKAKQAKLDQQQAEKSKKQQNGVANGDGKKKKDKENNQQQKPEKTGQMQKLQGGLMYQDTAIGKGGEAKTGKKVQVSYVGRLKSNNKIFDQTKSSGPGFKFILGRGEVIKAWDIGLAGMKVGGKRRLICPPQLAYGQKGNPPVIPPNSTLVFDVELKNVF